MISRKYIINVDNPTSNSTYNMQSLDFHFINYTNKNLDHLHVLHNLFQQKKFYNIPCAWFIYFDFTITIQEVVKKFDNAPLNFNDDFIVALNQKNGSLILWELYKIGSMLPIQHINIGKWTTSGGLKFTNTHKWNRRSNLLGYNFKFTSLVSAPYMTKIELDSITGKYDLEGSFADVLNVSAETLNFTYTYIPSPDGVWGVLKEDGTWNGMMNLIQKEEVDFGEHIMIN